MMHRQLIATLLTVAASVALLRSAAEPAADAVYRRGRIYTADATDRIVETIAARGGRIVYAGNDGGVNPFVGPGTRVIDLDGGFMMPGLVDGHMHPLEGGLYEIRCSLKYEALTVAEFRRRIQVCLDADRSHEPDAWLQVVGWFQQSMQPEGTIADRSMLDSLDTRRPILVRDAFGHTVLANSRALALARIARESPDPRGGRIERNAAGEPTGLLQDAAYAVYDSLVPPPTPAERVAAVRAALQALASQGITTALDADAAETTLAAFRTVQQNRGLTVRMHFAPLVNLDDVRDPDAAVRRITRLRSTYDSGPLTPTARLTVRNAKLFIDGVIAGPAFTGSMLEPYFVNAGTPESPRWSPGTSRGPDPYFAPAALADLLVRLGRAGIDPHLHVDGDRAVRAGLDAVAAMRKSLGGRDVRPAFAHAEIVHPDDYARFKELGIYVVLSTQWEKPAPDTVDQLRDYLGPARAAILEPAGLLAAAGASIAYGSDWPVDPLNEWFALKVAVTRENAPEAGPRYAGRLGRDPGLSRLQALRAITIIAARSLHCDEAVGSIEVGKLADLAILDRDPLTIPAAEIATVLVKETIVGNRTVYRADTAH